MELVLNLMGLSLECFLKLSLSIKRKFSLIIFVFRKITESPYLGNLMESVRNVGADGTTNMRIWMNKFVLMKNAKAIKRERNVIISFWKITAFS